MQTGSNWIARVLTDANQTQFEIKQLSIKVGQFQRKIPGLMNLITTVYWQCSVQIHGPLRVLLQILKAEIHKLSK